MKCRRVEKLIPLYVERDLASGVADQITSHLEWCGRCNWLADEYKESQNWLHSSDSPEFDEASLDAMKAGVLSRIEAASAKPSLFESFVHWNRRQVFAISIAALIIFGVVVFYTSQTRTGLTPPVVDLAERKPDVPREPANQPPPARNAEKASTPNFKPRGPAKGQTNFNPRRGTQVPERTLQRSLISQRNSLREPVIGISAPQNSFAGSPDDLPEMLRIEIQTSDPNIRIIWFAPKEVEGPKTDQ